MDNTSELRRSTTIVYRTDYQALSTARFCRTGQLATADTWFRTCRTSSFCTVAWQLARFQLTWRILRGSSAVAELLVLVTLQPVTICESKFLAELWKWSLSIRKCILHVQNSTQITPPLPDMSMPATRSLTSLIQVKFNYTGPTRLCRRSRSNHRSDPTVQPIKARFVWPNSKYTPWVKKTRHITLAHNFTKYWPIFKILSLLESVENL